jgi:hypothetical protein
MKRITAFSLLLIGVLALLACGGEGLTLFPRSEASELAIVGPADGSVFAGTEPLALQIGSADPAGHPNIEVQLTLVSAAGDTAWSQRIAGLALNEDLGLQLPELLAGRYQLEITVFQDGQQVARSTTTIFSVRERPRITGIASFPPLIMPSSRVLLSAEITPDAESDPWLRWTWRGKTIAQGSSSAGTTAVLWTAPAEGGVYTVTLELFPVAPPTIAGFSFRSSIAMSTDIYVSSSGAAVRDELGPPASYLSLFHFQADLADAAAAARNLARAATPIGSPRVVPVGDGFGYRLEAGAGFNVPWPVLPVEDGSLAPFTLSAGIRPEKMTGAARIITVTAGSLAITLGLGVDAAPELAIAAADSQRIVIPSGAPSLEPGRRTLVSVSVVPRQGGLSARWFLDGRQVSDTAIALPLPRLGEEGSAVVGGEAGLEAVIDELGVYYRDEAGRPATDPSLFRTAMRKLHGDRLLLADGFDGTYLPAGFAGSAKAAMAGGRIELPPEAWIDLPPIRYPSEGLTLEIHLDVDSPRAADVRVAWAGMEDDPFVDDRLAADAGAIRLRLSGDTATALTAEGVRSWPIPKSPAEKAGIVLRAAGPREGRSPLLITEVVAITAGEKE